MPLLGDKEGSSKALMPLLYQDFHSLISLLFSLFKGDLAFDRGKSITGLVVVGGGDEHRFKCSFALLMHVVQDNTFTSLRSVR